MRNKHVTRAQQMKQAIVNWLLDLDAIELIPIILLVLVLALAAIAFYSLLFPPQCIEGYVYIRGICVQGYKP